MSYDQLKSVEGDENMMENMMCVWFVRKMARRMAERRALAANATTRRDRRTAQNHPATPPANSSPNCTFFLYLFHSSAPCVRIRSTRVESSLVEFAISVLITLP